MAEFYIFDYVLVLFQVFFNGLKFATEYRQKYTASMHVAVGMVVKT